MRMCYTNKVNFDFQDYETETEKFKSILDLEDGLVPQTYKRSRLESPALKVKHEVCGPFNEFHTIQFSRLTQK